MDGSLTRVSEGTTEHPARGYAESYPSAKAAIQRRHRHDITRVGVGDPPFVALVRRPTPSPVALLGVKPPHGGGAPSCPNPTAHLTGVGRDSTHVFDRAATRAHR